jgi:hypothetical protein
MCTDLKSSTRRNRWLRVLASFALAAGLLLRVLAPRAWLSSDAMIDAFAGLLIGLSFGMNIMLLLQARRRARGL